jgi:gliding motility-associated-like protein
VGTLFIPKHPNIMARHFTYLLGLFFLLLGATAVAQPTYTIESKAAQTQGTVSVNVTVTNFKNVTGHQFIVLWDPNVIKLASITNCATMPGLTCGLSSGGTITNFNQSIQGQLRHTWNATGANIVTLPDNTVLLTLNFTVAGGAGTSSAISFGSDQGDTEIITKNGTKDVIFETPNVSMKNGAVQVSGAGGGTPTVGGLKVNASSSTGGKGDKVCVDITADNFKDIVGAQFLVTWDKTKLEYVSVEADPTNLVGATPNGQADRVIYVWSDQALVPQNLANGAKILTVCFKILIDGDGQTKIPVSITGTNLKPIEFGKLDGTSVAYTVGNGNITVKSNATPAIAISAVQTKNIACKGGTDGNITYTIAGGDGAFTYKWNDNIATQNRTALAAGKYTLTVTSGNATTITDFNITEPAAITTTPKATDAICTSNTGAAEVTVAGGTFGYTYAWSGSAVTTAKLENVKAGSYTVTVTDVNKCTATAAVTVGTTPQTVTGAVAVKNTICTGSVGTAEATTIAGGTAPYTYLWSSNANSATSASVGSLKAGNYTVTVTDKNGCVASFTQEVKTDNPIVVSGLTVKDPSCAGQDGVASFVPVGGTAPYTLTWSFAATFDNPNLTAIGLKPADYSVIVKDKNGCSAVQNVKVNPAPTALTASFNTVKALCTSASGASEATVSGGVAPYTYAWSNSGGTTNKIENVKAATFTLTVTDKNNCTTTFNTIVDQNTVNPLKIDLTKTTDATCAGATGAIDIAPNSGKTPYVFNWDNGAAATEDLATATIGKHTISVTDANGCIQSANYEIKAPDAVVVTAAAVSTKCVDSKDGSVKVASTTGGNAGAFTYTWSNGATGSEALPLAPGSYKVVATDSKGCKGESQAVTINTPTVIQITGTVAEQTIPGNTGNGSINLSLNGGTGAYTYAWATPTNNTNKDLTGIVAGDYTVKVKDANGCEVSKAFTVKTNFIRFDDTKLALTDSKCKIEGGGEINVGGGTLGGSPDYTYVWSPATVTGSNPKNLKAGNYAVTVSDKNGVSITKSFVIKTLSSLASKAINLGNAAIDQSNGKSTVEITGGSAPYTINWSTGNKAAQTNDQLPKGRHYVTITDAQGCTDTASVVINSKSILAVNINPVGNSGNVIPCPDRANGSINAIVTGNVGNIKYQWSANAGGSNSSILTNLAAGTYVVTVTDESGSTATHSITLKKPDDFDIKTAGIDFECDKGGIAEILSITGGTAPYKFEWNDVAKTATQKLANLKPGAYAVVMTDANGCQQLRQITVKDNCVPTGCYEGLPVITPNDDGANDVFMIKCIERITKQKSLEIYNRWGQSVFRSESYNNEWNGQTVRGKDLPDGNYFYVFEFINPDTNQLEIKQGSFTMLRE